MYANATVTGWVDLRSGDEWKILLECKEAALLALADAAVLLLLRLGGIVVAVYTPTGRLIELDCLLIVCVVVLDFDDFEDLLLDVAVV